MTRILSIAAALTTSAVLLSPIASHAQTPVQAAYYTATPVAQPSKSTIITRSTVWHWGNTAYSANKAPQREMVLCQLVAQNAGELSEFTVAGQPLDADSLAKCNAKAK